ncbi:MAG: sulfite exporter TauE/SafE family protein, partial [Phycisphaerae bacterium]
MGAFDLIALMLIGLLAGIFGGMLGVGGSIIMIPAMTEVLGPNQHLYQAAAMIVNFFVAVPAVYQHRGARAIEGQTVLRIVPLAVVAVIVGVGLSELPVFAGRGEANLRGLFGLFLLGVGAFDLYRLIRRSDQHRSGESTSQAPNGLRAIGWWAAAAVAVPVGLVAGLLGVGGGVMAVPLQRRLLHIPMRIAVANSASIIIATSLVGSIAKNAAYRHDTGGSVESFVLAGVLIPTAIVGSLFGSKLTHALPVRSIKIAFMVMLTAAALR